MNVHLIPEIYNKCPRSKTAVQDYVADGELIADADADGYPEYLGVISKPTRNLQQIPR